MRKITNDRELAAALRAWQGRLRLRDWKITAVFCHAFELGDMSNASGVDYTIHKREATVKIAWPSEVSPCWKRNRDVEDSLVHELLHLLLRPLQLQPATGLELVALEQMIETLAEALVEAHRRK